MVLESIISPKGAQKHPQSSFVLGFIYAAIAVVLSFFIFPSDPSLAAIFLTTLAALPLLINVLTAEEEEEMATLRKESRLPLIRSHLDVFLVFSYMFLGFLLCFLLIYVVFPEKFTHLLFKEQISTIESILGSNVIKDVTGNFWGSTGGQITQAAATPTENSLKIILLNNFKVMFFALLFSFLYGAGAIFILAWNASILAVTMGNIIKLEISKLGELVGFGVVSAYFHAGSTSVLRYFVHGIPEISAYFLAAVAGGIISAAVVRSDYRDSKFYEILLDSIDLIALASLLLIIGALLEVTITPWIFS